MPVYTESYNVSQPSSDKIHEQLRQQEARIVQLTQELSVANREITWAKLKIQVLEEKLRQERLARFGPRSETLSDLQLSLLEEEPSVTADEVAAEAERGPLPGGTTAPPAPPKRQRKPHPGRQQLPADLPRKEETIPCAPEQCQCPQCGQPTAVIGYDESEQLDVEPAHYYVKVIKREKRACRRCVERSVMAAPLPDRIVEKGLASNRVVVETVVRKYCDHLPLYRQAVILSREAGLDISRATLDGWVIHVGELLLAIQAAIGRNLLTESYLQADETTVWVQTHDRRGKNHEAYLWQFGRPGGEVVFVFAMGRGRDVPLRFLGQWEGKLQTDAYSAYDRIGGRRLLHYGCWSHARRYFVDAVKLHRDDPEAVKMVLRMDALFTVERGAKERGLTGLERLAFRREHGQSWLEEIHAAALALAPRVLPKSKLGEATSYLLKQWDRLQRCFEDPEVELSNNIAENSMRPWALGRKNWLHIGSAQAGPKVAAIASVIESCRRLQLPVTEYLLDVLPGLQRRTLSQVAELTPARWAAARS
jgi:transposase